jgi:two-component system, NtrC family, response regulator AtoC
MARVMVVEDDETLADNIRTYLERAGWDVSVFGSVEDALAVLDSLRPDVIVADYLLPGKTGLELLKEVTALDPQIKVVMTTGHGEVPLAVEAMKSGAYDYLCKPLVLAELKLLLERAMGAARMEKALSFYQENQARGSGLAAMLGESPAMQQVKQRIRQILQMEAVVKDGVLPSVLVTGETGTGKELVARALHFDGTRRDGPFVEINCASLPVNLLESELFGHERGAFTDAKERKVGLVEAAEGGTLFLDEIGEVELSTQAKLLKLLEERSVRRLGSTRERQVDVRIISATNRDLEKMVREGRFRSDLFFRLRIVTLHLPPLRERKGDILPLARHFIGMHGKRYGKRGLALTPNAECALEAHAWPGNVRELQNAIEQTVLLAREDKISCADLTLSPSVQESASPALRDPEAAPILMPGSCSKLLELERQLVKQVLESTGWNVSRAAVELGISRDMLRTRMERHGLTRPEK